MLNQVYEPLLGLILPELCQRCRCATGSGFCARCREDFLPNAHACLVCGCALQQPGLRVCRQHPPRWLLHRVVAPLLYAHPAETYLHRLKYGGERALGRAFGQLLADAAAAHRSEVDALVSVPLHSQRFAQRGYNQALEIARSVAATLRLPILRSGIARTRATQPQSQLDAEQRSRNLRSAFSVTRRLDGLRLAVVDDVITTGSTANALAKALLQAGAVKVEAWSVARTAAPSLSAQQATPGSQEPAKT